jgi:ABC-2 type transport system permease protein
VEIRGRQLALLLVFGPIVALVAVLLTAWSGLAWAWPWVLALTPALLGGGLGLVAWLSVVALVPGPDPHKRPAGQLEHADVTGPAYALFWMGLLPALPAAGVVLAGTLLDSDVLRWSGVPVGLVTGVFLAWWLGRVAYRRLQERGPELLALMRTARHSQPAQPAEDEEPTEVRYSRTKLVVAITGWTLGPIAAFPQGLVPMVIKLADLDVKSWFLALHMPEPLQWPTAILMVLIGACFLYLAIKASIPDKEAATPDEAATSDEAGTGEPTGASHSATGPSTLESV